MYIGLSTRSLARLPAWSTTAVYLGKLKMRAKKAKGHKIKLDKKGEVDCAVKRCKDGISEMGT